MSAALACGIVPEESSIPHGFGPVPRQSAYRVSPACLPRLRRALLDAGLRGGEPRDGHHVRRAGHVVHAHAVAELHRRRLAAVLAADTHLELGARLPPAADADLDQLPPPSWSSTAKGSLGRSFF